MENQAFDSCMDRIRKGEKDALHEIYEAYAGSLFHYIQGIVGNCQDAEDLTSELFIRIWREAGSYRPGGGHKRWLYTVAHNMAVDFLRSGRREIPNDPLAAGMPAGEEPAADDPADQVVERLSIQEALARLKDAEREIIHLKVIAGLTFAQISDFLQVPLGTITWRYRQGILKLRRCGYEA